MEFVQLVLIVALIMGLIFAGLYFPTREKKPVPQEPRPKETRRKRTFLPSEEWISVRKWLVLIGIIFLALKNLIPHTIIIEVKHSGGVQVDDVTPSYRKNDEMKVKIDQTQPLQVRLTKY